MKALKSLSPIAPKFLKILQFHYRQPERTITATELAHELGYQKYRVAPLLYGTLARLVRKRLDWWPKGKLALYVMVEFEKRNGRWHWIMREEVTKALEGLRWVESESIDIWPGEIPVGTKLAEGAVYRVAVTAYERNTEARKQCLAHHGTSCAACDFDFEARYGPIAEGFIHVHHLRMLSEIGRTYEIDPVRDLIPLCPNCHAVVHLNNPPYKVDELKAMIEKRKDRSG